MKSVKNIYSFIIFFLLATQAWPDLAGTKGNYKLIQIPLKLSNKPDEKQDGWKIIQFRDKHPNKVASDKKGLHIGVDCSANLLAYCLNETVDVNEILIKGSVNGLPKINKNKQQGDDKADDFAIRFGLVISGTKKLSPVDKLFASELVKRLCELVPKSHGIDHVLFLNLANDPGPKWRKRIHPIGKGLLREQIGCVLDKPGDFKFNVKLPKSCNVLALCIICDGDDTKSKFQITINNIQLNPRNEEVFSNKKP